MCQHDKLNRLENGRRNSDTMEVLHNFPSKKKELSMDEAIAHISM